MLTHWWPIPMPCWPLRACQRSCGKLASGKRHWPLNSSMTCSRPMSQWWCLPITKRWWPCSMMASKNTSRSWWWVTRPRPSAKRTLTHSSLARPSALSETLGHAVRALTCQLPTRLSSLTSTPSFKTALGLLSSQAISISLNASWTSASSFQNLVLRPMRMVQP